MEVFLEQLRDHAALEQFELLRVAEELRHADQEVVEEFLRFSRLRAQVFHVRRIVVDLSDLHPPLDAAHEGAFLVAVEVVAGLVAQHRRDAGQHHRGLGLVEMRLRFRLRSELMDAGPDPLGQLVDRQDGIRQGGGDVARGEFAGFRLVGLLCERDAAHLLDGLEAEGPVRTGPGEDDRDRPPVHFAQKRDEETVDGSPLAEPLLGVAKLEVIALDADDDVRIGQVDPARHERHVLLDGSQVVAGRPEGVLELGGIERLPVLQHDDDGRVGPGRQLLQEVDERARFRGRRAQGDDDRLAALRGNRLGGSHHPRLQPQRICAPVLILPVGRREGP